MLSKFRLGQESNDLFYVLRYVKIFFSIRLSQIWDKLRIKWQKMLKKSKS